MTSKELKRLSRSELLELLIDQQDELAQMQVELENAKTQLDNRSIIMEKFGTMAEAAIALNGVFQAADNAAKQYLENIQRVAGEHNESVISKEEETRLHCEEIIAGAKEEAKKIVAQAEEESRNIKRAADDYMKSVTRSAKELLESVQIKLTEETTEETKQTEE